MNSEQQKDKLAIEEFSRFLDEFADKFGDERLCDLIKITAEEVIKAEIRQSGH